VPTILSQGTRVPDPDPAGTIQLIGDMHFGQCLAQFPNYVLNDIASGQFPEPLAYVQVGDSTNSGTEDSQALAFLNALPKPWYTIVGNTDVYNNGRTVAAWETAYGMSRLMSVDLGRFILLLISPDSMTEADVSKIRLSTTALSWLDAQLAAATKPCLIGHHAPLAGSHGGWNPSSAAPMHTGMVGGDDDTPIRAVLAAHDTAWAWISGHIHNRPYESLFIKEQHTSGVTSPTVACVSASSFDYNGHTAPPVASDWCTSTLITIPASGDRIEVRCRDHKQQEWTVMDCKGTFASVKPRAA